MRRLLSPDSGSPRSPSPFGIRDNIKSGSGYNSPAGGKRSGHQKLVFAEGDYPVDPRKYFHFSAARGISILTLLSTER
jgi:hypothetical protein